MKPPHSSPARTAVTIDALIEQEIGLDQLQQAGVEHELMDGRRNIGNED